MKRKLSLFLIVSFLGMQVLSFLHMAEYGFDEHEHNGRVCDVYLQCEHTKYGTPSVAIAVQTPEYFTFTLTSTDILFVRVQSYGKASPRAPPLFS